MNHDGVNVNKCDKEFHALKFIVTPPKMATSATTENGEDSENEEVSACLRIKHYFHSETHSSGIKNRIK